MSSHQVSVAAQITFRPGVSVDAVLAALNPITAYCGYSDADLLSEHIKMDDTFEMTQSAEAHVSHLELYLNLQAGWSFQDVVDESIKALSQYTEPGYMTISDYDTGDLENAIRDIWFGAPAEVAHAERIHGWETATDVLRAAGYTETEIESLSQAVRAINQAAPAAMDDVKPKDQAATNDTGSQSRPRP